MLKPEPPAPFPSAWWQKFGNQAPAGKEGAEGAK
jgi:hypothetical protein